MSGSFGEVGSVPVAQNGMGINAASNSYELGGDLTRPTTINASATNTLGITGLTAGSPLTDEIILVAPDGTLRFMDLSGIPDFWRTVSAAALPGGTVADTTDAIRRLGSVGIGGAALTDAMPTVTTPVAVNRFLHLSNSAAGRGQIMYGSAPLSYHMTRTLPTVINDYVSIGSFSYVAGAHIWRLSASVEDGGFAAAKMYLVAANYNATGGAWRVLKPTIDGGAFGSNNFELLVNIANGLVSLRIRRTAGATAGTVRLLLEHLSESSTALTELNTTGTDATAYTVLSNPLSDSWNVVGNTGTTNTPYNDNGAQANNFAGTTDNVAYSVYTNAGNANAKTDFKLYTATPTAAAITAPVDIFHIRRNGQTGVTYPQVMSIALGHWLADGSSRTRADFRLGNGNTYTPDFASMSLFSQGGVGINGNGTAGDWAWSASGGIGRGNVGALLGMMGANGSGQGPHIGVWTPTDAYPLFYQLNWSHNNVAMLFDGYFDGAWRSSTNNTRAYAIYKVNDALNFYGQQTLAAAPGNAWAHDLMGRWRYAGATLPGGELDFGNVVKNRRIVLFDANAASDNQYYGFGINASTLRYQVDSARANHVFFAGTSATTSNELARITGTGRLGVGTSSPTAFIHANGPNANGGGVPLFRLTDTNIAGSYFAIDNGQVQNTYRAISTTSFEIQSAGNTSQLYLSTNGGVGVGTAVPTAGNGNISVAGNGLKPGGGAWGAFSDRRVKEDVKPVTYGLAELSRLIPVTFKYNGKAGTLADGRTYYSLIAQDVMEVIPDFVEEIPISDETFESMDAKDQETFSDRVVLGLKEGLTNFESILINAIKELAEQNKSLLARVTALEGK